MADERVTEYLGQTSYPGGPEDGRRFLNTSNRAQWRYNGSNWRPTYGRVGAGTYMANPQVIATGWVKADVTGTRWSHNLTVDAGNNRITVVYPGWYHFCHWGYFESDAGGTYRAAEIRINGNAETQVNARIVAGYAWQANMNPNLTWYMSAGQYAEVWVYQDSRTMYYYGRTFTASMVQPDFEA